MRHFACDISRHLGDGTMVPAQKIAMTIHGLPRGGVTPVVRGCRTATWSPSGTGTVGIRLVGRSAGCYHCRGTGAAGRGGPMAQTSEPVGDATGRPVAVVTGAGRGIGRATAIELGRAGY